MTAATARLLQASAGPAGEITAPAKEITGSVHSWDLSTGVDGPGTRFVVFTAGCPLRCVTATTRTPGSPGPGGG